LIRYYPSRRAVFAVALGIPLSLLAALVAPALWTAGLAWSLFAALLMGLDLVYGASARKLTVTPQIPGTMGVGRAATAQFTLQFAGAVPAFAQSELEGNERFAISPRRRDLEGGLQAEFELKPLRRGEGRLENLWLRWTGPMGLVWIQRREPLARAVPIVPDIQTVREEAVRLFQRDEQIGSQVTTSVYALATELAVLSIAVLLLMTMFGSRRETAE